MKVVSHGTYIEDRFKKYYYTILVLNSRVLLLLMEREGAVRYNREFSFLRVDLTDGGREKCMFRYVLMEYSDDLPVGHFAIYFVICTLSTGLT